MRVCVCTRRWDSHHYSSIIVTNKLSAEDRSYQDVSTMNCVLHAGFSHTLTMS